MLTDAPAVEVAVEVPRDRDGSFEPVIVKKRQRRLSDVDAVVLSLYAKGLTTGEISGALRRDLRRVGVQGHRLADHRPGDRGHAGLVQPAVAAGLRGGFIDAIMVKVRDGQVGNRPFYAAIGVDLDGHQDVSGCGPATAAGSRRSSG